MRGEQHFSVKNYFDKWGMIGNYILPGVKDDNDELVQAPGWIDGGDTLNRMGLYHLCMTYHVYFKTELSYNGLNKKTSPFGYTFLTNEQELPIIDYSTYAEQLDDLLWCKNGSLKRHPDPKYWSSDCDRLSRDQIRPTLALWSIKADRKRLGRFFRFHLKRGLLFMSNTRNNVATAKNHGQIYDNEPVKRYSYNRKLPDATGPSIWASYIRGFRLWPLYPLLCLFDLEFFVNSVLLRLKVRKTNDVVNHLAEIIETDSVYPTPLTLIANRFINNRRDLLTRLKEYFKRPRDPAFLGDMLALCIKRILP